jgi:hypothetical protein
MRRRASARGTPARRVAHHHVELVAQRPRRALVHRLVECAVEVEAGFDRHGDEVEIHRQGAQHILLPLGTDIAEPDDGEEIAGHGEQDDPGEVEGLDRAERARCPSACRDDRSENPHGIKLFRRHQVADTGLLQALVGAFQPVGRENGR